MRIVNFSVKDFPPIQNFVVNGVSDLIVIAGPNGVGKSRLAAALLQSFHGVSAHTSITIEPTNDVERERFQSSSLDMSNQSDFSKLASLLHQNRRRRNFNSAVLYYESTRSVQRVQPLTFSFEFNDPWDEEVSWSMSMDGLSGRWTDTQHAIFKKIHSQRTSLGVRAQQLRAEGKGSMSLEFDDPLAMFKEAFSRLLAPKELTRADLGSQNLMYEESGQEFQIDNLSSGEKEVVRVCFDFILRKPSDCIVVFDEPEVHLHPELLIRMINTLRSVGERNQFILLSHSPDLISSSLEDTVVFLTPRKDDGSNQAVVVGSTDQTTAALHALGQSIGVLSLGRKIVIIEGADSSLDKRTYSEILRNRFPNLVLVAGGGRDHIEGFQATVDHLLDKAVWGVSFYLYTDLDAQIANEAMSSLNENTRRLRRYHLENYFLDAEILAECFSEMEPEGHWLRDQNAINLKLRGIASTQLGYITALTVSKILRKRFGNIDVMPKGAHGMPLSDLRVQFEMARAAEAMRFNGSMLPEEVREIVDETYSRFESMVNSDDLSWTRHFPGKPIFLAFCGQANIKAGRLKSLYIRRALKRDDSPFDDIIADFSHFSSL